MPIEVLRGRLRAYGLSGGLRATWARRARIVGSVGLLQVIVMATNVVAGLLIVRTLDKGQYALFTVALTMAAMLVNLSDCGVQAGLLSIGGCTHRNRDQLSEAIATARQARWQLTAGAVLLITPLTFFLLRQNDASWLETAVLTALVIAGAVPAIASGTLLVPLGLLGKYSLVQWAELLGSVGRLVWLAVAILAYPVAAVCLVAYVISVLLKNAVLLRFLRQDVDLAAAPSPAYRKEILGVLRSLWFPTMFSAIQGQIGIWLLSVIGTPADVADLGALSRFAAIFGVVSVVITSTVTPTFARCQDRAQLIRLALQAMIGIGIVCGTVTALGFKVPWLFAWVLGPRYQHFSIEIGLYLVFGSIGVFTTLLWGLMSAKLWLKMAWIVPPLTLLAQCLMPGLFNVSTVTGALCFMIASTSIGLIYCIAVTLFGFSRNFAVAGPALG